MTIQGFNKNNSMADNLGMNSSKTGIGNPGNVEAFRNHLTDRMDSSVNSRSFEQNSGHEQGSSRCTEQDTYPEQEGRYQTGTVQSVEKYTISSCDDAAEAEVSGVIRSNDDSNNPNAAYGHDMLAFFTVETVDEPGVATGIKKVGPKQNDQGSMAETTTDRNGRFIKNLRATLNYGSKVNGSILLNDDKSNGYGVAQSPGLLRATEPGNSSIRGSRLNAEIKSAGGQTDGSVIKHRLAEETANHIHTLPRSSGNQRSTGAVQITDIQAGGSTFSRTATGISLKNPGSVGSAAVSRVKPSIDMAEVHRVYHTGTRVEQATYADARLQSELSSVTSRQVPAGTVVDRIHPADRAGKIAQNTSGITAGIRNGFHSRTDTTTRTDSYTTLHQGGVRSGTENIRQIAHHSGQEWADIEITEMKNETDGDSNVLKQSLETRSSAESSIAGRTNSMQGLQIEIRKEAVPDLIKTMDEQIRNVGERENRITNFKLMFEDGRSLGLSIRKNAEGIRIVLNSRDPELSRFMEEHAEEITRLLKEKFEIEVQFHFGGQDVTTPGGQSGTNGLNRKEWSSANIASYSDTGDHNDSTETENSIETVVLTGYNLFNWTA